MQTLKRSFIVLSTAALLAVPAYVLAQDPPRPRDPSSPASPQTPSPATPQTPAPMPQERASAKTLTAKGEIVSVDDATKTLTIKDETGADMKFTYDDKTDVSGAKEGIAGLATQTGSKVTVKYSGEGAIKTATKIEVQRQRGTSQP